MLQSKDTIMNRPKSVHAVDFTLLCNVSRLFHSELGLLAPAHIFHIPNCWNNVGSLLSLLAQVYIWGFSPSSIRRLSCARSLPPNTNNQSLRHHHPIVIPRSIPYSHTRTKHNADSNPSINPTSKWTNWPAFL